MPDIDTITLADFIADQDLVAVSVTRATSNPNASGQWADDARHWTVTIGHGPSNADRWPTPAPLAVPFSQGSAHTDPPTLEDVLDCLASDARSFETYAGMADGWIDWADELGAFGGNDAGDPPAERVREALNTWRAIERQSKALEELLGADVYATLIDRVEPA